VLASNSAGDEVKCRYPLYNEDDDHAPMEQSTDAFRRLSFKISLRRIKIRIMD
jgi:hypothetical protein